MSAELCPAHNHILFHISVEVIQGELKKSKPSLNPKSLNIEKQNYEICMIA